MLNILVCLYLLNSVHRVVVSTHSLPHTLSVSNTVRTLYSDSDPVFTSVPRLAWENRHGWLHLFATFQTKLFALYFSFYVRLVRRKNWFLNCNSVKVRFVFNSLWIKFRFYFVQKEGEKKLQLFVGIANNTNKEKENEMKLKPNFMADLWESATKAQHLVPSWKFDLVKINHSVELCFHFEDFRNSIALNRLRRLWSEGFSLKFACTFPNSVISEIAFTPNSIQFNPIAMCISHTI